MNLRAILDDRSLWPQRRSRGAARRRRTRLGQIRFAQHIPVLLAQGRDGRQNAISIAFRFNPGPPSHLMPHRFNVLTQQQRSTVVTLGRLEIDHVLHLFDRRQLSPMPGVSRLPAGLAPRRGVAFGASDDGGWDEFCELRPSCSRNWATSACEVAPCARSVCTCCHKARTIAWTAGGVWFQSSSEMGRSGGSHITALFHNRRFIVLVFIGYTEQSGLPSGIRKSFLRGMSVNKVLKIPTERLRYLIHVP